MKITCSICLQEIGRNDAVALAVCGHVFDLTCILHCLQMSKRCPLCSQDVFGTTHEQQFIRMYFSTDDSDEKIITQLKFKINKISEEIQKMQNQAKEHDALKQEHIQVKKELQRSRELITLLHEKYNDLRVELGMAKVDLAKKN
ncbi:hypothetical protein MAM1_0004c00480 [Mucor ambiguus]|uniref:RING-type domain-containing protein n=1 Tax=Mucor ambiguus TaxID=91626 RepID=A0A0C9M475_9FUNG|nr:hypothetical protein MAM1_0004c00480 [Mucor ambiguus]